MKHKVLRVSYSFLSLWKQGKYDLAIAMYHHIKTPTLPQYEEGIVWDNKVQQSITKSHKLPKEFGGDTLKHGIPQFRVEAMFSPYFKATGVYDILDGDTIYETKSGKTSSRSYSSGYQMAFYFLLAQLADLKVKKGIIIRHNQHDGTTDRTLLWNTPRERNKAINLIETVGGEAREYFLEHDLFTYGKR